MAFKVCGIDRMGTNALLLEYRINPSIRSYIARNPELASYFPVYSKGATIHAVKGSAGIFCFKSKKSAQEFIHHYHIRSDYLILKVRGIKTILNPRVLTGVASHPIRLLCKNLILYDADSCYKNPARDIPGLVCFESVKVLE